MLEELRKSVVNKSTLSEEKMEKISNVQSRIKGVVDGVISSIPRYHNRFFNPSDEISYKLYNSLNEILPILVRLRKESLDKILNMEVPDLTNLYYYDQIDKFLSYYKVARMDKNLQFDYQLVTFLINYIKEGEDGSR